MPPFYVEPILPKKLFTMNKGKIILFGIRGALDTFEQSITYFVFLNSIMRPLFEMSHDCHIHKGDAD